MKKIIVLISLFVLFAGGVFASDYDSLYENAQPFQSKLYNGIDPYEDEDSIIDDDLVERYDEDDFNEDKYNDLMDDYEDMYEE